jgi:hypothetical protein
MRFKSNQAMQGTLELRSQGALSTLSLAPLMAKPSPPIQKSDIDARYFNRL